MEATKYDVFISYSRKDYVDEHNNVIPGNEVSKIKDALTEAGITFWMDEKGIVPGEDYAAKILRYIKACKIFVFISSAAANQSEWTRKETACALMYKKEVIPLLLDDSPFHDAVMLRIADLDRIDYYVNPKKGLEKLISSIKTLLSKLTEEERRKKEEEELRKEIERKKNEDAKRRKEEEVRQQQEQQEQLVEDIRTSVIELNIEETKLDLERTKLLVKTEKVMDMAQRESLKTEITESSPLRKKSQAEINRLQEQVAELKTECDSFEEKRKNHLEELAVNDSENAFLRKEIDSKKQDSTVSQPNNNKWVHVVYGVIILFLIWVICVLSCAKGNPVGNNTNDSINLTQETVVVDSILELFIVDSVKFKMIKVEGGTFLMGAQKTDPNGPNYDKEASNNESPVHEVMVNSFYIGETEVTQALWKAVMGTTVRQQRDKWDPEESMLGEGDDYPMYYIYRDECQEFIKKLNSMTGKNFRLPTEAEWEYAARGGEKSLGYNYSGSNAVGAVAWYDKNGGSGTHTVKGKKPNELGLYDMSGNVWEMCQDWYDTYANSERTNLNAPSRRSGRLLRGGAWYTGAGSCRVSSRSTVSPGSGLGFRLVLPEEISPEKP